MNTELKTVARECTEGSDTERLTFPEVVTKLMGAGVERYHADLLRAEKTFYTPEGESHVVPSAAVAGIPAHEFSAASVEAAVRAIQGRTIKYGAFCERIVAAGCVGYMVSLAGRRAVYYGRTGETHVEHFPAAR